MKRGIGDFWGEEMSEMFYTTTMLLHNCIHIYQIQILHLNYYSFNVFKLDNSIYLIIFFPQVNFKINHLRIFLREFFSFFLFLKFYLKLHWNLKYMKLYFSVKLSKYFKLWDCRKRVYPLWVTNWWGWEVALDNRNKKRECEKPWRLLYELLNHACMPNPNPYHSHLLVKDTEWECISLFQKPTHTHSLTHTPQSFIYSLSLWFRAQRWRGSAY